MNDVAIAGELLIDMVSLRYVSSLSAAERFERHFGGSPGNIALNLKDMGLSPILISRVGRDPFGEFIIRKLTSRGVDTSRIQMDPINSTTFVMVSKSRETPEFLPLRGADNHLELPGDVENIFEKVGFFHFSSWPISKEPSRRTTLKMLSVARKKGVKICFDPNYRRILWENGEDGSGFVKGILKDTFLAKPSEDDARHIFGEMTAEGHIRAFHECGSKNVVLTLGKKGVVVSDGKRIEGFPSVAKRVVDTTGAGDAFWSGMYFALSNGKDVFEAARIGSVVAAFRVETVGSDEQIPAMEKLVSKYRLPEGKEVLF